MTRPHVAAFLGLSLDGFIAGPDHDLEWLECVATDPPEDTGYDTFLADHPLILLGRRTYDTVAGFPEWPYARNHVWVLSHRPVVDARITRVEGTLPDLLRAAHREGFRAMGLEGGQVIRQALDSDCLDRLTLSWLPITLGSGIPLFGPEGARQAWRMEGSRSFPSGLLQATYWRERKGPAEAGPLAQKERGLQL